MSYENALRGNDLPQSKLNPGAVRFIRKNELGLTRQQLADTFKVHINTIDKVRTYQTWAHVKEKEA